jgi:hypothetical protein
MKTVLVKRRYNSYPFKNCREYNKSEIMKTIFRFLQLLSIPNSACNFIPYSLTSKILTVGLHLIQRKNCPQPSKRDCGQPKVQ